MSKNNIIKIIRTTTANLASLLLNPGELAIDTITQKLYCGTDGATFTDQLTPLNNSISLVDVLEAIYPVGALYFANTSSTTCPLETLGFGTWQLVAQDACIQGSSTNHASGSSLSAGLPNIATTSTIANFVMSFSSTNSGTQNGPIYWSRTSANKCGTSGGTVGTFSFDASNSNAIYGNSTTVQPPAYVVNIWERISPSNSNNNSQSEPVIIIPDDPGDPDTPDDPEEP